METTEDVRFAEQPGGMTARTGWTWDEESDAPAINVAPQADSEQA